MIAVVVQRVMLPLHERASATVTVTSSTTIYLSTICLWTTHACGYCDLRHVGPSRQSLKCEISRIIDDSTPAARSCIP